MTELSRTVVLDEIRTEDLCGISPSFLNGEICYSRKVYKGVDNVILVNSLTVHQQFI